MGFKDRRLEGSNVDGVLVQAGEMVVGDNGSRLVSVVGAGLLVCLWHRGSYHAAMSHFLYPSVYDVRQATARYGNVALPKAIAMLKECIQDPLAVLEAQIFGAAQRDGVIHSYGENVEMARKILTAYSITIVSEDVGGTKGRKVMFDSQTGHAMVIKVHALRESDWELP